MNMKEGIATRLKDARTLAGLSQGQVAQKLGMHRPTISEIEAGRRNVAADELQLFANLYGVTVPWLMGEQRSGGGPDKDALVLAARELGKIKEEDLDRLMRVITMVRSSRRT